MRKFNFLIIFCLLVLMSGAVAAGEKAPAKVFEMARDVLAAMGRDPIIVKAVKEKNARGESLDQVKAMDEKWKNTPGVAGFMKEYLDNECGQYLAKIMKQSPYFGEIFVMDQNGAIVAMTDKTSDYWQGDEAKFINSYKDGSGAVFVDEVEFDDSSQTYLVQVSMPVMDDGRAIGAITFGIDVDRLK